mmetsp:Transcript_40641/g.62532  ORF Transcript_40641/g.62532 Transcript_40641/m.62532 type:complete len:109 (+) Transcript_40641:412-738(+)
MDFTSCEVSELLVETLEMVVESFGDDREEERWFLDLCPSESPDCGGGGDVVVDDTVTATVGVVVAAEEFKDVFNDSFSNRGPTPDVLPCLELFFELSRDASFTLRLGW